MVFVVPEGFLESYSCNECFKFLSVTPIKIYRNHQIKCGRCTKNDDGGTYSLFQNFAELALFKCINRFDGCRTMLTSNQVQDHEKQCLSKEQFCPICGESTKLPTYIILQHFKLHHKDTILENPHFSLDIGEKLEFSKILLYRIKDYLFFIYIKYNTVSDSIFFKIVFLGHQLTTNIVLNFSICSGNSNVKISMQCSKTEQGFNLPKSRFENNLIYVLFELKEEEEIIGKIIEASQNNIIIENRPFLQRKLYIRDVLQNLHPGIRVSNTEMRMGKIVPFCYICSELFNFSTLNSYNRNCRWFILNDKFQYVCLDCSLDKTVFGKTFVTLSFDMFDGIFYFCSWNCNSILSNKELQLHEFTCSVQPLQNCPIDSCIFNGSLFDINNHFKNYHNSDLTSLSFGKTTIRNIKNILQTHYFWINGNFIKLLYKPKSIVPHKGFCIHNIHIDFCKTKPQNLKAMHFCFLHNEIVIPFTDYNNYLFMSLDHSICNNSNTACKVYITDGEISEPTLTYMCPNFD